MTLTTSKAHAKVLMSLTCFAVILDSGVCRKWAAAIQMHKGSSSSSSSRQQIGTTDDSLGLSMNALTLQTLAARLLSLGLGPWLAALQAAVPVSNSAQFARAAPLQQQEFSMRRALLLMDLQVLAMHWLSVSQDTSATELDRELLERLPLQHP